MPAWLQSLLNRPQTIVWFAFIAFVVVSSIIKKIKAEKLKREIKQRQAQAELDRLRTGGLEPVSRSPRQAQRPPQHTPMMPAPDGPTPSSRQASLEEIAEARRRKIAEMRSRQTAGGPAGSGSQGTRVVRLPNGVTIEVPAGMTNPPPVSAPAPTRTSKPAKQRPQPKPTRDTRPEQPAPRPPEPTVTAAAYAQAPSPIQMTAVAARAASRRGPAGFAALLGSDRASVRRAIILSEVLGPPVSAR